VYSMQKDRASQKERESEGQRQREKRTVYKTQQTTGKNKQNRRVGKKKRHGNVQGRMAVTETTGQER